MEVGPVIRARLQTLPQLHGVTAAGHLVLVELC